MKPQLLNSTWNPFLRVYFDEGMRLSPFLSNIEAGILASAYVRTPFMSMSTTLRKDKRQEKINVLSETSSLSIETLFIENDRRLIGLDRFR